MEIKAELEDRAKALESRMAPRIEAVKERLTTLNDTVVGFIKAHPGPTLLGALALGFLVGRIARGGGRGSE